MTTIFNKKGMLVILSGPAGSGKDTVLDKVFENKNESLKRSISMTTRKPRDYEIDGEHYYFVDEDFFNKKINDGQMIEYTVYNGCYYGTPKVIVDQWLSEGKTVILKIEVDGAGKIKKLYPDAVSIFIIPPSLTILEQRLRDRGTENEDDIIRRLAIAENELKRAPEYDYIVINDTVETAVNDVHSVIRSESLKISRNKYLISEVTGNA